MLKLKIVLSIKAILIEKFCSNARILKQINNTKKSIATDKIPTKPYLTKL
jgi:hypothetical protein